VKNEPYYLLAAGGLALVGFNPELENHHFGVFYKHRNGRVFLFVYALVP
jgi:hypothetical protein